MKKVYCVYEDNHGMIGLATDYSSSSSQKNSQ